VSNQMSAEEWNAHLERWKKSQEQIALLEAIRGAAKKWAEWLDSPGDGTDKTFEEEREMLNTLRKALTAYDKWKDTQDE